MKPVTLTREDILAIERAGQAQIAQGGVKEGFLLLSRCLAWRFDSGIGGETLDLDDANVIPFPDQHSRRMGA